jgi:tetratricopeptide (TPR) repeat protein
LGRAEEAQQWWKKASEAQTGFRDMAYYRALALRRLGREPEAVSLLKQFLDFASRQLDAEVRIDYFATSLPNFLLFDDDLQKRNRAECLFLRGLAKLGLRRIEESAADFREALTLDPNHMWAQAELERIEPIQATRLKP